MHILPGYYKFIWHITIRIFPPKFSEWTTLQIYEVRGQELHWSVSVTHGIKVVWLPSKERDSSKSGHKMVFFACLLGVQKIITTQQVCSSSKGSWIKYVSIQRCLISVSGHLTIKPSRHQPLFWMLMDVKLFCQLFNLSNAKVYILQTYTCILTICITKNRTHLMQGSSIRIERLVFGLTLNSNKLDEKVKILRK